MDKMDEKQLKEVKSIIKTICRELSVTLFKRAEAASKAGLIPKHSEAGLVADVATEFYLHNITNLAFLTGDCSIDLDRVKRNHQKLMPKIMEMFRWKTKERDDYLNNKKKVPSILKSLKP